MNNYKMIHLIFFITTFGNVKACRDKVLWCDWKVRDSSCSDVIRFVSSVVLQNFSV